MKKENVFVVIDTEKKANKVAKVLAMFNENCFSENMLYYTLKEKGSLLFDKKNNGLFTWGTKDSAPHLIQQRKEVSVSELKQILAMEHLKKGDVVVCRKEKYNFNIFEVSYTDSYYIYYKRRFSSNDGLGEYSGAWFFENFHRYATEEEKQLLNPGVEEDEKKDGDLFLKQSSEYSELLKSGKDLPLGTPIYIKDGVVGVDGDVMAIGALSIPSGFNKNTKELTKNDYIGKWVVIDCHQYTSHSGTAKDAIVYYDGSVNSFGFDYEGYFCNDFSSGNNIHNIKREATQGEVSQIFFKECHRIYPNKISFVFNFCRNEITSNDEIVFKNGTWLEAKKIEIDPLKELKEAHKKGFEIEYKSSSGVWKTSSNPAWRKTGNYRIRPRKIGDWFRTTNSVTNVNAYIQINETNINNVNGNDVRVSNQMVIDILNNGKYTV